MPDIEDIIENLAPFAFVLIWILSAVFGRNKEQAPAKTTRPVFAPGRNKPEPAARGGQPAAQAARNEPVDWRSLEGEKQPFSDPNFDPPAKPAESAQEKIAKALRERAKREDKARRQQAAREAKAAQAAKAQAAKQQSFQTNSQVNLTHLVSDHAAETHLEHALADRAPSSPQQSRQVSKTLGSALAGVKDKEAVRKAMIMSIVLGEPKSKQRSHRDLRP
jgi:hypothetical protein